MITLWNLFEASLLCLNAVCVLHEERFMQKMGWGANGQNQGFEDQSSVKFQILNLVRSIRTVTRIPLIILNILTIIFNTYSGLIIYAEVGRKCCTINCLYFQKCPKKRLLISKSSNETSTSSSQECQTENIKRPKKRRLVLNTSNEASTSSANQGYQDENDDPMTKGLKSKLEHYKTLAEMRGRKLKNLQRKFSRVVKKKDSLEVILNGLKLEEEKNDELPLATEALVFMVTCVNEAWKIPVGYFMANGLSGEQKHNLVIQCIRLLNETDIRVISLTFDGAPSNAAMATKLGCNLKKENLVTHFKVDKQEVAIMYDPCHNIKLIRNAWGEKKVFLDSEGNEISWIFVERLLELQAIEGLHAANKLTVAHVNYENQKMKVKLATQLLSKSVTDALQTCKEKKIFGFENCDATIKFIRTINDLFDIMNSRNLASYGFKKPLNSKNISESRAKMLEIDEYINRLKLLDGTFVLDSRKKTGFLGFKICIKSALFIYDKFINDSKPEFYFLPLYKLSQDHIEIFFGAIRSMGGFNNNPSGYTFMSAYKKLLVHAEFKISRNGNCLPLDDIRILHSANPNYAKAINNTAQKARLFDDNNVGTENPEETEYFDHDYTFNPNLSEFSEMVVVYISGAVTLSLN
ncbi:unnamed protein product [Colias eurytheme]|nr:unnamed protein product [Colias eurytheme]